MGLEIITETGTFTPAMFDLKAGDLIQVIAVGGGGGGGVFAGVSSSPYGASGGSQGAKGSSGGPGHGVVVVTW